MLTCKFREHQSFEAFSWEHKVYSCLLLPPAAKEGKQSSFYFFPVCTGFNFPVGFGVKGRDDTGSAGRCLVPYTYWPL